MPSDPSAEQVLTAASAPDRRLHPMSFLFVMLISLRQFAVPIIVMVVLGRRGTDNGPPWELIGAIGAAFLMLNAVVQYFTYRFRIERDGLRIRSGVLQRTYREVPFRRIHNVTVHRNLLHRLFGVAEVRLESAGGVKPEAEMRVLRLDDAQALEALVREHHGAAVTTDRTDADAEATADPAMAGELMLSLPPAELVRLGLISNRGMIVVAAAFGLMMQAGGNAFLDITGVATEWLIEFAGFTDLEAMGTMALVFGGGLLILLAVLVLRLLSIALSMLQFYGFRLTELDGRIQVDAGLLTRVRGNTPLRRIQAFSLHESLLHRWFGRRSLKVDTAVMEAQNQPRSLRDLAPVATPARIDGLLARLFPQLGWPALPWQPLHPRAWRRMLVQPTWALLILTAVLTWHFGAIGLTALALAPVLVFRARLLARCSGYAVSDTTVAVRQGWLDRRWRFAEIGKLQAVEMLQSPFDRRHGMATLWFDTAGASSMETPLRARYLPVDDARRLARELSGRIASSRLNW